MAPLPEVVFSRPYRANGELSNLKRVLESDHMHGDGPLTASATARLQKIIGAQRVFVTSSCTHALEMASLLLGIEQGDEVIMPSFTFPSAATAVALRGARCVFVDIDSVTGNIDAAAVEAAITPRTRAISVMHYGGVAADMTALLAISKQHSIPLIEDNAHGLGGTWNGRQLGTLGEFGTQSFHDTKNVQCGEGGALVINNERYVERAEIIREKGTDRTRFLRGQTDKYTWTDIGSSYLPSEFNAAVLDAQLAAFDTIQKLRHDIWNSYATELADWAAVREITLMRVPEGREHTAHLFYLLLPSHEEQRAFIEYARARGIATPFHYLPLDSSPAGLRYGRTPQQCTVTANFSSRLVRLPLWAGLPTDQLNHVLKSVQAWRA